MNEKIIRAITNDHRIGDALKEFVQIDYSKDVNKQMRKYKYSHSGMNIVPTKYPFAFTLETLFIDEECYFAEIKWDIANQKIAKVSYRSEINENWIEII